MDTALEKEMNKKMISVIVPVHNTFRYVKECLESILNQTYANIEVICIDSSTDRTVEILKDMAGEDSRIRLIFDTNSSYGYKVNRGIREAQGNFIAIVDSDDYLEREMFQRLIDAMVENDADFVKSDHSSFFVENEKNVIDEYISNASEKEMYCKCIDTGKDPSILYKTGISIWTGLYKKSFLIENNIFMNESEGASFQDAGFSVLTHLCGRKIYYLCESFYRYRTDNINSSVKSEKKYETIAEEWRWIDRQVAERKIEDEDILLALRARKLTNYEWNINRLSPAMASKFACMINDELDIQYLRPDLVQKLPPYFQEMFHRVYEKGLQKIPAKTEYIIDLLRNRKVALVGCGELACKIISYDIERGFFGIHRVYDLEDKTLGIDGFYLTVRAINSRSVVKDYVYLIPDVEGRDELYNQLMNAGIGSEQINKVEQFYLPADMYKQGDGTKAVRQGIKEDEVKVSIIVPVYNVERYLEECLQSLISQDESNLEIICVDDGSTDRSAVILKRMCQEDERIRVVTQKNQGLAMARNTGLRYAHGKYVMFCDSDDMLKRNSVRKLYEVAQETCSQIVSFDAKCIYMTEELVEENNKDNYYQRSFSYGLDNGKEMFTNMIEDNCYCDSACLMFIDRDWIVNNNLSFYAGILYEDCLFSVQCMMKAEKVYHINEQFYIYRVREGSIMTSHVNANNLYGRLINIHNFYRILFTENLTERQENALAEFTREVGYHAKWLAGNMEVSETDKLLCMQLTPLMRLELEQYGVNADQIRRMARKDNFDRVVESAEKIEIYGAGIRGRRLLAYLILKGYGNKICNFVVTAKGDQQQNIDGVNVFSAEEGWKPERDKLLIISFAGKEADELYRWYQNIGVTDIIQFDNDTNYLVVKYLRERLRF